MKNKELKAIVDKQYTLLIIVGLLVIICISTVVVEKIQNFLPDINLSFWMLIFALILFCISAAFMDHFLVFKEVITVTFQEESVVLKRGKKERTIPYTKIKKVVKYMIIDRTYRDKGYYRMIIKCKGRNYVMYSGEDAELKLDFEQTEVGKIYYEFKHRGIMCC